MNECLNEIESHPKNEKDEYDFEKPVTCCKDKKTAKQYILHYLDLCSEEFYLYKYSGIVTRKVWKHWFRGMESYFKEKNIFQEVLKKEIKKYTNTEGNIEDSYYGFLRFLKNELELND
jgi:hypothetical protein